MNAKKNENYRLYLLNECLTKYKLILNINVIL